MNPDTAPIEEVEAWLAPRLGWTKHPDRPVWYHYEKGHSTHGVLIGPSMDAAIACLPPGWYWECEAGAWNAWPEQGPVVGMMVSSERSREPILARDELLRLAAKAWQKMEEAQ